MTNPLPRPTMGKLARANEAHRLTRIVSQGVEVGARAFDLGLYGDAAAAFFNVTEACRALRKLEDEA